MVASAINFILFSSAFSPNGEIPSKYTCEGQNISPPLSWQGAPANTKSFALIMDDPDAPDPQHPKTTWVHWVLFNIPANVTSLKEHIESLPEGTGEGFNDWHKTGYGGPCPPIGRHRYFHKVYALDTRLTNLTHPNKAALEKAMQGHILAHAELVGTYMKGGSSTK
ncbi:MAG TPA: YbhB/YbcL family Raf kinase inhibitor-like protein [Pseudobdellovibrionaceae bacterium]